MASPRQLGPARALKEVEALARTHTHLAVATLAEICMDGEAPAAARVSAAGVLLDRGWGRAPQEIRIADTTDRLSDDGLRNRMAARLAELVSGRQLGVVDLLPDQDGSYSRSGSGSDCAGSLDDDE